MRSRALASAIVHNRDVPAPRAEAPVETTLPFPHNRKPSWRLCIIAMLLGAVMTLLARLASFNPEWLEQHYVNGAGAQIAKSLSTITGLAPFSVAEPLMVLFACWLILPALPAAYQAIKRRRSVRNVLACGATRAIAATGFLVAIFYVCWGFNYSRAALPARLGWDDSSLATLPRMGSQDDRDELVALCTQLIIITNHYYTVATGTPDSEAQSAVNLSQAQLDRALEQGYARASEVLNLDPSFAALRGPAKAVFASRVLSELGIAGFYAPWTGEANYNYEIPPFQLPMTIAHEKAHQRCVASEDEANFLGFMACVLSDEPYARYAGYLFAQRQLLNELIRIDPAAARALIALRCKGVQSDVIYSKFFWRIFGGPAQIVSHAVNDMYLKANRVDGGMFSYQMSARLIVLFSRENKGVAVVNLPGADERAKTT
jgi:hypothetical protein